MTERPYERLSDKILDALVLCLKQRDLALSEKLSSALEMAMTRNAGGQGFVERRHFTKEVEEALNDLDDLRKKD